MTLEHIPSSKNLYGSHSVAFSHAYLPLLPQDRIRQYFEKIKNAETGPARQSIQYHDSHLLLLTLATERTTVVDKEAANRFITHAISQAHLKNKPTGSSTASTPQSVHVPAKTTSKMVARAQYEQELRELDEEGGNSDEADKLEVFDESQPVDEENSSSDSDDSMPPPVVNNKGKGKATDLKSNRKRQRTNIDPFTGKQIFFGLVPLLHFLNSIPH